MGFYLISLLVHQTQKTLGFIYRNVCKLEQHSIAPKRTSIPCQDYISAAAHQCKRVHHRLYITWCQSICLENTQNVCCKQLVYCEQKIELKGLLQPRVCSFQCRTTNSTAYIQEATSVTQQKSTINTTLTSKNDSQRIQTSIILMTWYLVAIFEKDWGQRRNHGSNNRQYLVFQRACYKYCHRCDCRLFLMHKLKTVGMHQKRA